MNTNEQNRARAADAPFAAIGPYAFSNRIDITQPDIPEDVALVGYNAFANTPWIESQPDGLVYAGDIAYQYKGEMPPGTHIKLRGGTIGIAGGAFHSYTNLVGITIPEGCIAIGNIAFLGCENLARIDIPGSVKLIEPLAFDYTAWLDNQPDGVVYAGCVAYCYKGSIPRDGKVVLRDGTVSITSESFAFTERLYRLKSVTIPASVAYLGEDLFGNCSEDFTANVTIRCKKGSCAHIYADMNSVKVELM